MSGTCSDQFMQARNKSRRFFTVFSGPHAEPCCRGTSSQRLQRQLRWHHVFIFNQQRDNISAKSAVIQLLIPKKSWNLQTGNITLPPHWNIIFLLITMHLNVTEMIAFNRRGEWIPVSTPSRHKHSAALILFVHELLPCVSWVAEKWFCWARDDS